MKNAMLVAAVAFLAMACGRSPAMPRTPVKTVPMTEPEGCACDDDEDDDVAEAHAKSVQYVPIDAWQPPPSVQQLEARVQPRGPTPPDYVSMPALTLHKPIPATTIQGRLSYYYR